MSATEKSLSSSPNCTGKRIRTASYAFCVKTVKFVGYINIVKNKGRRYIEKDKKEECPIPDYSVEYLEKYRETLMESVAETSEEFMDRYFGGEEFSVAEISAALAMNVGDGTIVPVCMGSPVNLQGVSNLLDDICGYFPDPSTRPCAGINLNTNEIFEANYDFAKPKSATIFRRSWIRSLENIQ